MLRPLWKPLHKLKIYRESPKSISKEADELENKIICLFKSSIDKMKEKIIIVGSGGHAKSVIEVIESTNNWEIVGLIGLKSELNKKVLGYEVVGTDDELKNFREIYKNCFIAIGQIKSSEKRFSIAKKLKKLNFQLPRIILQVQ